MMSNRLEELKLAESWEFIQGGFLFLDETGDALLRANAELKRYIHTLSSVQPEAASLIARLKLEESDQTFEEILFFAEADARTGYRLSEGRSFRAG